MAYNEVVKCLLCNRDAWVTSYWRDGAWVREGGTCHRCREKERWLSFVAEVDLELNSKGPAVEYNRLVKDEGSPNT